MSDPIPTKILSVERSRSAHWHEAYTACPCGCGYDGDFLIDDDTGKPIQWACSITGATAPIFTDGQSEEK